MFKVGDVVLFDGDMEEVVYGINSKHVYTFCRDLDFSYRYDKAGVYKGSIGPDGQFYGTKSKAGIQHKYKRFNSLTGLIYPNYRKYGKLLVETREICYEAQETFDAFIENYEKRK